MSMKSLTLRLGRLEMNKIKNMNGVETNTKNDIINNAQHFYTELYRTKREPPEELINQENKERKLRIPT